jgi:hypothetical protein
MHESMIIKTDLDRVPTKREWIVPIAIATISGVISLGVAGYVGYTSNDKELAVKVGQVETQQRNDGDRLNRIEIKVDSVDDKIDRILERVTR